MFVASAIVATGAFIAIQADGASGIAMDIGAPLVNTALHQVGIDGISAPTSQDGGASWLVVSVFLIAFFVAAVSFMFLAGGGLLAFLRRDETSAAARDSQQVVSRAADVGRRQAAAALRRGSDEYAKAKPKLVEGAKKGRRSLHDDITPRVVAEAGKAASKSRQWIDERRSRPPNGS